MIERERCGNAMIFMALGKGKAQQDELFIPTAKLATGPGHPFYSKVNEVLAEAGFDDFAERLCAKYYKDGGRPGIRPGVYFRMLFVGYFERLASQRGIAWHCADSLGLRSFLGIALTQDNPVHASMTIIRQRLPESVFHETFPTKYHDCNRLESTGQFYRNYAGSGWISVQLAGRLKRLVLFAAQPGIERLERGLDQHLDRFLTHVKFWKRHRFLWHQPHGLLSHENRQPLADCHIFVEQHL